MVELIARKRIGRVRAGGRLRLAAYEARALLALGYVEYPQPVVESPPVVEEPVIEIKPKRTYRRRDMTASVAESFEPVASDPAE